MRSFIASPGEVYGNFFISMCFKRRQGVTAFPVVHGIYSWALSSQHLPQIQFDFPSSSTFLLNVKKIQELPCLIVHSLYDISPLFECFNLYVTIPLLQSFSGVTTIRLDGRRRRRYNTFYQSCKWQPTGGNNRIIRRCGDDAWRHTMIIKVNISI